MEVQNCKGEERILLPTAISEGDGEENKRADLTVGVSVKGDIRGGTGDSCSGDISSSRGESKRTDQWKTLLGP